MKTHTRKLTLFLISASAIAVPVACKKHDVHPTPVPESSCKIYSIVDSLMPDNILADRIDKKLFTYDNAGNIVTITDTLFGVDNSAGSSALQIQTNDQHFRFDPQGYLQSTDNQLNYVKAGTLISSVTQHTDYTYDNGRLIKKTGTRTYPTGVQIVGDTSYAYDQAGHLVTYSYGGATASYEYTNGSLSKITLSSGPTVNSVYTVTTDNKGQILKLAGVSSEVDFQYDENGNETRQQYWVLSNLILTTSYEYDKSPNPEKPLSPDYKGFPNEQYIHPYIGYPPPVPTNNYTLINAIGQPTNSTQPPSISAQTYTNTYEPVHHSLVNKVSIVGTDNSTRVNRTYTYTGCQ